MAFLSSDYRKVLQGIKDTISTPGMKDPKSYLAAHAHNAFNHLVNILALSDYPGLCSGAMKDKVGNMDIAFNQALQELAKPTPGGLKSLRQMGIYTTDIPLEAHPENMRFPFEFDITAETSKPQQDPIGDPWGDYKIDPKLRPEGITDKQWEEMKELLGAFDELLEYVKSNKDGVTHKPLTEDPGDPFTDKKMTATEQQFHFLDKEFSAMHPQRDQDKNLKFAERYSRYPLPEPPAPDWEINPVKDLVSRIKRITSVMTIEGVKPEPLVISVALEAVARGYRKQYLDGIRNV